MSGGIAYVYDPNNTFPDRVNYDLVTLQRPNEADLDWLHQIIVRHQAYTGSHLAQTIINDWTANSKVFCKVMPRDYERVLAVLEAATAEGLSEVATSERVMESVHG